MNRRGVAPTSRNYLAVVAGCMSIAPTAANVRAQELCESRGGRLGLPVLSSPNDLCGRKAKLNLNCVKVEVAVLGSPSLAVLMVSVDVKQH